MTTLAKTHDDALDPPVDDFEDRWCRFLALHAVEIDQALDILADLHRASEEAGLETPEYKWAGDQVAETCRMLYPGFTRADRMLVKARKGEAQ